MANVGFAQIRLAKPDDVPVIVRMLADDHLGRGREKLKEPLSDSYFRAFEAIERDERNVLIVAETTDGLVIGCLQLTIIPGLSHQGADRALIEDVRVDAVHRRKGVGRQMVRWAIDRARGRGCSLIQLFVHESREEARRFYEALGFEGEHFGMRLSFAPIA